MATPPPLVLRVSPSGNGPGWRTVALVADGAVLLTGPVEVGNLYLVFGACRDAVVRVENNEDAGVTG